MNIFFLDYDPSLCAEAMVDSHVVKMVLETAQLLSTAHHQLQSAVAPQCYKQTHVNHPSAVWARKAAGNYDWLYVHFEALAAEYTHRFGREHKSFIDKFMYLSVNPCPNAGLTVPLCALPEAIKPTGLYTWADSVEAYRTYYRTDKARLHKYTNRQPPSWL